MTLSFPARAFRPLLWIPVLTFITTVLYYSPRCRFFRANDLTLIRSLESETFLGLVQREWSQGSPINFRPVTSAILWLQSQLFHDYALGYYIANFGFHSINTVLLFAIGRRLGLNRASAALGTSLFLVSPVPFRTLLWISDVAGIVTVGFVLASVLLWLESKGEASHPAWALSCCAAAAAMFTKEPGVTAAAIPLALDLALVRGRPLRRLWKYFPMGAALGLYLYLSLRPIPGWREYPEVYQWGWHAVANALFGIGFAVLPLADWGIAAIALVGFAALAGTWAIWPDRRNAALLIAWMLLAALPTSPFRPTGFDNTGRYAYAWIGPLSLTAACLFQRAGTIGGVHWPRRLVAAGVLMAMMLSAHRLAQKPYRTNPGMVYFDYAVLSLMEYGSAQDLLELELGCPPLARVDAAKDWLTAFVQENSNRADWALPGRLAKGMTEWLLRNREQSLDSWRQVEAMFVPGQTVELLRGAPVSLDRVRQVREHWVASMHCTTPP